MAVRSASATYRRLLGHLVPHRVPLGFALAAALVTAAAAGAYAYIVGPVLKAVLSGESARLGPLTLHREDLSWAVPQLIAALALVKALSQWLQTGLMGSVGQAVVNDLRTEAYGRLLFLPPRFFERRHSGELLSRLTADVAQVEFAVTCALSSYVKDGFQTLALLGVCAAIDLRLFLLAFVMLPAAVFPVARFGRSIRRLATRMQAHLGSLTELAGETLHNLPLVQAYRGQDRLLERFDAISRDYLASTSRSLLLRGAFTPLLEVMALVGVAAAVSFGASAVAAEPQLAGKLLSFLAAALLMYQPLKAISGTYSQVAQGLGAASRLFELEGSLGMSAAAGPGSAVPPLTHSLELRSIRVTHDGRQEALKGLTVSIPAGSRVALVGASGAGKSTLFSLLLGLVEPTSGELLWDGAPASRFSLSARREQLAWVPQEPVLFSGSVRQNLALGKLDASESELWEALRRAHADALVHSFRRGLDEQVGERGSRLSGGQRQRLAIARAFLRRPSLLLLDEPTSSLDAASEREVQAGLTELMAGRTALVIAHRLSTVREANLICVLDDGVLVEQGSHAELSREGSRYAQLLRAEGSFLRQSAS